MGKFETLIDLKVVSKKLENNFFELMKIQKAIQIILINLGFFD